MNNFDYIIKFVDNTEFKSNSLSSKWNQMPKKLIKELRYYIGKQVLIFKGYKEYNHVFKVNNIIGIQKGISNIFIIVKDNLNNIREYNIDLRTLKCIYSIRQKILYSGWKQGVQGREIFDITKF